MVVSSKSFACTATPDLLSAVTILRIFISLSPLKVKSRHGACSDGHYAPTPGHAFLLRAFYSE